MPLNPEAVGLKGDPVRRKWSSKDSLIAWQNFGDLPHEAAMASQRRLIEKVAPAFST